MFERDHAATGFGDLEMFLSVFLDKLYQTLLCKSPCGGFRAIPDSVSALLCNTAYCNDKRECNRTHRNDTGRRHDLQHGSLKVCTPPVFTGFFFKISHTPNFTP